MLTQRLILKRPTEADVDAIFELHSDPRTNMHNPAGPMQTRAAAAELLKTWDASWCEDGYGYWTVFLLNESETVIGFGGVMKKQIGPELFDNNLYFRFRPEVWGQGYAGEMVRAALAHTFDEMGQERVFGSTRVSNTASRKTLERAGLELTGTVDDVPGREPSVLYRLERQQFQKRLAEQPESSTP